MPTIEERFLAAVTRTSSGCWQWTGSLVWNGYGRIYKGRRQVGAHRWAYEHFIGPVPEGMQVDHLCRNRGCVNPQHLEAVTQAENVRRGTSFAATNAAKTHCIRGHELAGENLLPSALPNRACRECARIASRVRNDRTRVRPLRGLRG